MKHLHLQERQCTGTIFWGTLGPQIAEMRRHTSEVWTWEVVPFFYSESDHANSLDVVILAPFSESDRAKSIPEKPICLGEDAVFIHSGIFLYVLYYVLPSSID